MNETPSRQSGAVLIVCLLLMLLMAVISANTLRSSTLQERMAGNARDRNSAFQAAEAALRAAESVLESATLATFDGSSGLFPDCTASCRQPDWHDRASSGWVTVAGITGVSAAPQYYIDELAEFDNPKLSMEADTAIVPIRAYRITARGFGVSDNAMVVLRTVYRRE